MGGLMTRGQKVLCSNMCVCVLYYICHKRAHHLFFGVFSLPFRDFHTRVSTSTPLGLGCLPPAIGSYSEKDFFFFFFFSCCFWFFPPPLVFSPKKIFFFFFFFFLGFPSIF